MQPDLTVWNYFIAQAQPEHITLAINNVELKQVYDTLANLLGHTRWMTYYWLSEELAQGVHLQRTRNNSVRWRPVTSDLNPLLAVKAALIRIERLEDS